MSKADVSAKIPELEISDLVLLAKDSCKSNVKLNQSGPLAHLVERLVCTEEASGSNPLGSTNKNNKDARKGVF